MFVAYGTETEKEFAPQWHKTLSNLVFPVVWQWQKRTGNKMGFAQGDENMESEGAKSLINKGNEFYKDKNYEEAIKCYDKATQLNPKNTSAFHNWGNALYELAQIKQDYILFQNAFEKYDKATQLDLNDAYTFNNWGNAISKLAEINKNENLFQSAFEKYKKAVQLYETDKDKASAYYNWGNAISKLAEIIKNENLFQESFEKYDKATQLNPNYAFTFNNWGNAISKLAEISKNENLFQKSFEKYDKATQLDQNNVFAFYNWGYAISKLAEINKNETLRKEFATFEKASKNIDDSDTLLIKGELYFILGEKEKVEECFKKSEKDVLEILTFLDEDNREKIIETKTFHSLLDSDNKDGVFFKEATKNLTLKQKNKLDEYKEIYIRSIFIISLLHITNDNEKFVAHYSKKDVSQKLLFDKDSKFRLNAINYSNDPTEGKTLLDFLYEKLPTDEELDTEYETFAGCFTFNYDNLNQFRLYGKEDGTKEGTGLSLVFKDSFFSKEAKMSIGLLEKSFIKDDRSPLYRCIYIDPQSKTGQPIITVGQKEEYLFYRERIENKFYKYNAEMNKIIKCIGKEMKYLKNKIKNLDPIIVGQLLLNLRYLVKHVAFKEEQECRIVKILNLFKDKKDIKDDNFKQMYFEYPFAVPMYIDKIYFGPKAKDFELFKNMLKYKGLDDIHCEKSTNPLA